MSGQGSSRQPDTWISLNRTSATRSAQLGVHLNNGNDAVTVALPDGDILHIYGNGQVWRDSTSRYFHLQDEEIDWR